MAIAEPYVEWHYDPCTYWRKYGLLYSGNGMWQVVQVRGIGVTDEFFVLAEVDSRQAAIGFLKLLKEQS